MCIRDRRTGARPQEVQQAEARLAQAEATLAGARRALQTATEGQTEVTDLRQAVDAARAQVDAARAQQDQAEAARLNAQQSLERVRGLFEQGAVARQQLDDARERADAADARVAQARAAVAGARDALRNAEQALKTRLGARGQVEAAETRVREAEAARRAAAESLSLVRAGTRGEQVSQAEAALRQAEANVQGARAAEANARRAHEERIAARSQAQAARTQAEVARGQADAARAQLDLLRNGETAEAIAAARGQVQQAAGVLAQAETALANTVVHAPGAGTVTEKVAEIGEFISPGLPIIKTADLEHPWLKVYLPLPRLGAVKVGQPARVTTDARPGHTYHGRVVEVSDTPEFTPKNIQTREQRVTMVFWVKVAVDDAHGELKPGMPADATIEVAGPLEANPGPRSPGR